MGRYSALPQAQRTRPQRASFRPYITNVPTATKHEVSCCQMTSLPGQRAGIWRKSWDQRGQVSVTFPSRHGTATSKLEAGDTASRFSSLGFCFPKSLRDLGAGLATAAAPLMACLNTASCPVTVGNPPPSGAWSKRPVARRMPFVQTQPHPLQVSWQSSTCSRGVLAGMSQTP